MIIHFIFSLSSPLLIISYSILLCSNYSIISYSFLRSNNSSTINYSILPYSSSSNISYSTLLYSCCLILNCYFLPLLYSNCSNLDYHLFIFTSFLLLYYQAQKFVLESINGWSFNPAQKHKFLFANLLRSLIAPFSIIFINQSIFIFLVLTIFVNSPYFAFREDFSDLMCHNLLFIFFNFFLLVNKKLEFKCT